MTAQLDRSSSSTNPLSISLSFKSNEKAIKNKRVLVNTENESKVRVLYIVRVCMYVYIQWFVCTVAMIYFPVKRRIFVFPAVEMNVGQKWPRNKRPALNTHAYFIRMNYCGGLCLSSLPLSSCCNVNYHQIHVSDITESQRSLRRCLRPIEDRAAPRKFVWDRSNLFKLPLTRGVKVLLLLL